ncbi:hypothetical protein ACQY0O_004684 [Thecaphora frezii]
MSDISDDNFLDDDIEDTMDEDLAYGYDENEESDYAENSDEDKEAILDDYGNANNAFAPTDLGNKKTFEVDYQSHLVTSIESAQKKEVDHVASMFMIKDTEVAILLRHFGWNKERLIERYMDSPETVNLEAGVHKDPSRPKLQMLANFTCEVCYTSSEDIKGGKMEMLALACGHWYCKSCYQQYMDQLKGVTKTSEEDLATMASLRSEVALLCKQLNRTNALNTLQKNLQRIENAAPPVFNMATGKENGYASTAPSAVPADTARPDRGAIRRWAPKTSMRRPFSQPSTVPPTPTATC